MLTGFITLITQLTEAKKPGWPRVVFPAVAFFAIALYQGWIEISVAHLAATVTVALILGGIFYAVYYVTLHKLIRATTHYAFGLETYDLLVQTLRDEGLYADSIGPFKMQALLGSFFLEYPRVRRPETVLMSSVFHGLYMVAIIGIAFSLVKFAFQPDFAYSFSALLCFLALLFSMWCDSKFGENAESLCILRNKARFITHLRSHLATSSIRPRVAQIEAQTPEPKGGDDAL